MGKFRFTKYTKNMYCNNKSKFWSIINNFRIKKTKNIFLQPYIDFNKILEFGSFDLYLSTTLLDFFSSRDCKNYTFTDVYGTESHGVGNEVLEIANYNLNILKNKYTNIKFNLVSSSGENINKKLKEKFNTIFIFETLEHVQDEKRVISNLNQLLTPKGTVIVSVPVEFGLMFFIKEMGRLFVLGKTNHSFKEIIYATFGKLDKVKRVINTHKGYDYRVSKQNFYH